MHTNTHNRHTARVAQARTPSFLHLSTFGQPKHKRARAHQREDMKEGRAGHPHVSWTASSSRETSEATETAIIARERGRGEQLHQHELKRDAHERRIDCTSRARGYSRVWPKNHGPHKITRYTPEVEQSWVRQHITALYHSPPASRTASALAPICFCQVPNRTTGV